MTVALHYFRSNPPNFGDEINTLVWRALVPELDDTKQDGVLVGIGTILDSRIPPDREVFVIGAGAGLAPLPAGLHESRFHVLAVRGPLTAALSGLPADRAVTDSALLLREIYPQLVPSRERKATGEAIFVPHFTTANDRGWQRACARAGVEFVDPRADCRVVLRKIAGARLVIAEAMHAAVVADAFRVPWIPVSSTPHFSTFKWVDWTLSMRVPFRPIVLPAVSMRHGCQQVWLRLFAMRCQVDGVHTDGDETQKDSQAVEALLNLTVRQVTSPQSSAVRWWSLKAAAFHRYAIDPLVAGLGRSVLGSVDERREARAGDILRELAATHGYLSADEVCTARLETLLERVAQLRHHLATALQPRQPRQQTRGVVS